MVEAEFKQSAQEGKDFATLEALHQEFITLPEERNALEELHAKLLSLPIRPDFPFKEPSDLESIRQLRPAPVALPFVPVADDRLFDKLHGAWIGRCCGCALGKPVESFMDKLQELPSWQRQKNYLTAISDREWPLRNYFPGHSPAEPQTGSLVCPASTRENIRFMETDDDIRYTVLGQMLLEKKGFTFSTADVAALWLNHLPYSMVCTAETQAYRNLVALGSFHLSKEKNPIDWHWVATHLNPYREWIGAQIRVDSYGYAAPGNPELAAELAWRDASLSHVKNGIYGAMFCAAMIAASFATPDPQLIIEAGLGQIPTSSRLYGEIRQTIAICQEQGCNPDHFETFVRRIYALLGHYSPVHTNNNAALCVAALLFSKGDFEKGITLAVMGGWDTDCNGATVGSIVGAITGAKNIPARWSSPLRDTLHSEIPGYHPISISECAQRSLTIVNSYQDKVTSFVHSEGELIR